MAFSLPDTSNLPRYVAIAGEERIEQGSGITWDHIYPANGQVTSQLKLAGAAEVDLAVKAARAALPGWRALTGEQRRNLLLKVADLIEQKTKDLAALDTLGNGYPSMISPYTPMVMAQRFRYYAGWADKVRGETLDAWNGPAHNYVNYEPYGVIGAIIPWNGPLFAAAMVLAPALAAGNCVVIKAPELAPYSVMRLAELFEEAGFPAGVVNMVCGGPDVGEAIVASSGVDKVQFVGSGNTAKKVLQTASQTLKPCGLELGGKSAVIVFEDANLQDAAKRGMSGAVSVSGQGCVNGTRLLVQRSIYDQFLAMIQAMASHVPLGDPLQPTTVMGPLISAQSQQRVEDIIAKAKEQGARLLCGGDRPEGDFADGFYMPLTIFADVDPSSDLFQHEVFGPVLSITPFDTEEEAIALANDSDYGLGAYVHTQNLRRAHHVASKMEAGTVQVNASGEGMQPYAPFGGYKQSGYGRLGGEQGLLEFLQVKSVWMNLKPVE
ncbi:aldehyde dehydrogenase [Pseudomaricurvus sp. HS19]|uniref:aldehyde dehydrogenase family protein n=1 Tax=Pseudomaricurvus sp. HS19 TaxID=2692626 RepID=UPI00136EA285|nr:aldehyde dehydrogenase family protein [Pseudomaricurvus sp. HS19]MYM61882.1 aldehyde dehydrogenase family protein [Pseudomaricurvus sp. HS19]